MDQTRFITVYGQFHDSDVSSIFPEYFNDIPGFSLAYPDFPAGIPENMYQQTHWNFVVGSDDENNIVDMFLGKHIGIVSLFLGRNNPLNLLLTMTSTTARALATALSDRADEVDIEALPALAVSPPRIPASATTTVTLIGTNTSWAATGVSLSASFGDVVIGLVNVISDTLATVEITTSTTTGTLTYTDTDNSTTADQDVIDVSLTASPVMISSNAITPVTLTGTNTEWTTVGAGFHASFGDAMIGPVNVASDTSVSFDLTAGTTTGTITYTDVYYSTTATQEIVAAEDLPSFTVSPATILERILTSVTFTGTNTLWESVGAAFTASFPGVVIGTVTVVSDTEATADVTADTQVGTMTYTDTYYSTTATQDVLEVTLSVAPVTIPERVTTSVTFTGTNTKWTDLGIGATFTASFLGVTIGTVTVNSDTEATADVTTDTETGTMTYTDSYYLATADQDVLEVTLSVAPTTISASATTSVTFTGTNTKWTEVGIGAAFTSSFTGATIGTVTVVSDTSATADVTTDTETGTMTYTDSYYLATADQTVS